MEHSISVMATGSGVYQVTVRDADGDETVHMVRLDEDGTRLFGVDVTDDPSCAQLIRRSFMFLLEREPKEAILREFNLRDIQDYFPDYKDVIGVR